MNRGPDAAAQAPSLRGALLSEHWYRVAGLKPALRTGARFSRHRYRGETWYVLADPASQASHRLDPVARSLVAGMDGTRSVEALWSQADRLLGDRAPTQDELIQLLAQLHAADLLHADLSPDAAELFTRGRQQRRQRLGQSLLNPMAIKLPLFDPDRLLDRLWPWVRPLWNRWGALLWLLVVLPALLLAAANASELTHNLGDRVFAAGSLLTIGLVFPLLKALHELAHGLATKARGGEVHDMGLMLLVLMPVPYVDASESSRFPDKRDRALVAGAGMGAELFVAALAMYAWLLMEPGFARSIAFNVMLVAGVTTLLFNGNPLLRYDAYYLLADLIEVPNLAQRANRAVGWLLAQRLFGAKPEGPPPPRAEHAWLLGYAVTSFAYRMWISVWIVLFVAGQFFVLGVLMALWAVVVMLLLPLARTLRLMATHAALQPVRGRVAAVSSALLAGTALLLLAVPVPQRSEVQGVRWLPDQSLLRAGTDGFLTRWLVAPGTRVEAGQPLADREEPALVARRRGAEARVAELQQALWTAQGAQRPAQAALVQQDLQREQALLESLARRESALRLHAAQAGQFVVTRAADAPGRYHREGDLLGHVLPASGPALVRVFVPQERVDLVRHHTTAVRLRLAHDRGRVHAARIVREIPAGQDQLPSAALAPMGGGPVAVDPRDPAGLKALQRGFQFDLALDTAAAGEDRGAAGAAGAAGGDTQPAADLFVGARAWVQFIHPSEPLAVQWARSLRQLFLARFGGNAG